jgi:hypothetical protein
MPSEYRSRWVEGMGIACKRIRLKPWEEIVGTLLDIRKNEDEVIVSTLSMKEQSMI